MKIVVIVQFRTFLNFCRHNGISKCIQFGIPGRCRTLYSWACTRTDDTLSGNRFNVGTISLFGK